MPSSRSSGYSSIVIWRAVVVSLYLIHVVVFAMDGRCSTMNCKLPECRCPGHSIPGGFKPKEVPQMVLITFDDAVNWDNWEFYLRLFPPDGSRRNPNGCPIQATFFVSHNFTDYCMVRKLHARGQEIADHSVTHRLPHAWWAEANKEQISYEILSQRKNLADLAHIPIDDIKGWRSPFLQPSGDNMFEVLHENNFTYDATMTYPFPRNVYSPVMWPFTLDFSYTLVCNIQPCPANTYPALWVIPVVVMMDYREHLPCAYVDHCTNEPRNHDETFEMLWKNFLRNYRTNRAPVYVNLHSIWLETPFHLDAMDHFIQRLSTMDDVYVLSVHKALYWMRDPTPVSRIKDFQPWQCNFRPNQEDEESCSFTFKPRRTGTATKYPPTTTAKPHNKRYHQTHIDQYDGNYPYNEDDDLDHNGMRPEWKSNEERGKEGEKYVEAQSQPNSHRNGHHAHHHRPWFLRGCAPKGSSSAVMLTVVLCVVVSFLAACLNSDMDIVVISNY